VITSVVNTSPMASAAVGAIVIDSSVVMRRWTMCSSALEDRIAADERGDDTQEPRVTSGIQDVRADNGRN
jgi:hypothetical protein